LDYFVVYRVQIVKLKNYKVASVYKIDWNKAKLIESIMIATASANNASITNKDIDKNDKADTGRTRVRMCIYAHLSHLFV